jgi:segregation and condensation protein B
MTEQPSLWEPTRLKTIIESLLFVGRKPLPSGEIEQATGAPSALIAGLLEELAAEYREKGINIVKVAGGYLMGTNPANAEYIHNLLHAKVQTTLSPQSLETLAIVAYRQPITRAEIERIRGVISDGVIETLLTKKLIQELGRSPSVGHPYLYGTTSEFLRHFGLHNLSDLPPLPAAPGDQEKLFKSALQE